MTHPTYHSEPNDPGLGQLIPLHEARGEFWVDARMLHLALGVGTRFSDWITRRLVEALATEGEDFYSELSKTPVGGRPSTQYHLSVDLAKEVAMLERTARGKAIRRYFIDAERALREGTPAPVLQPALPTDPIELLELSLKGIKQTQRDVQELRATTAALQLQLDNTPVAMFPALEGRLKAKCQELGKLMPGQYPAAYRALKAQFSASGAPLARYNSLPARQFEDAMRFLDGLIVSYRGGCLLGGDQA